MLCLVMEGVVVYNSYLHNDEEFKITAWLGNVWLEWLGREQ